MLSTKPGLYQNYHLLRNLTDPSTLPRFVLGLVDPSELLANIEAQISKVKAEALSRKEIMDRIERWLSACEEENWLEDYNLVIFFSFF